jgi:hypothetical protein
MNPIFLKKIENHISELKKKEKIFGCSQLFIPQTCKKSCSNTLYPELHKNEKHVDLSTYISGCKWARPLVPTG